MKFRHPGAAAPLLGHWVFLKSAGLREYWRLRLRALSQAAPTRCEPLRAAILRHSQGAASPSRRSSAPSMPPGRGSCPHSTPSPAQVQPPHGAHSLGGYHGPWPDHVPYFDFF
ncbi:hypothetical protein NDU88_005402 [Pleurodeles waltl]|uniref:Uncharacterized protein n=1 Tax=Pleurodeles waltl TaxID=8319 RepID=A0AAV7MAE7_PLEWA|nr:hypothetical protein NDU88_005402 [Pleurodeles waltl]